MTEVVVGSGLTALSIVLAACIAPWFAMRSYYRRRRAEYVSEALKNVSSFASLMENFARDVLLVLAGIQFGMSPEAQANLRRNLDQVNKRLYEEVILPDVADDGVANAWAATCRSFSGLVLIFSINQQSFSKRQIARRRQSHRPDGDSLKDAYEAFMNEDYDALGELIAPDPITRSVKNAGTQLLEEVISLRKEIQRVSVRGI